MTQPSEGTHRCSPAGRVGCGTRRHPQTGCHATHSGEQITPIWTPAGLPVADPAGAYIGGYLRVGLDQC